MVHTVPVRQTLKWRLYGTFTDLHLASLQMVILCLRVYMTEQGKAVTNQRESFPLGFRTFGLLIVLMMLTVWYYTSNTLTVSHLYSLYIYCQRLIVCLLYVFILRDCLYKMFFLIQCARLFLFFVNALFSFNKTLCFIY